MTTIPYTKRMDVARKMARALAEDHRRGAYTEEQRQIARDIDALVGRYVGTYPTGRVVWPAEIAALAGYERA